ncbi:MAG: cadherin-like domain-containing protein [Anaerolineae bacterium]|nr:cadherin-like domain-containing protein [Anaerolineae bacterium]
MNNPFFGSSGRHSWRRFFAALLFVSLLAILARPTPLSSARAQDDGAPAQIGQESDAAQWYRDHEIEHAWRPGYLELATGDPSLLADHGVYAWPYALDSIGWDMQSYQDYGGTPYFHHGMDMMKVDGTDVYNRSGGQVINIENYNPGWYLYWEVAVLDPDGYIWQYHHIDEPTIPQYIWDKFAEYQADPVNGGFIPLDTYIGDIVEWPVWSFGKQFNHIHLNILAAGGVYVNGFEFHTPLPDFVGPEIQAVGLLQNGQIYAGNEIEGSYSLYVRARDLILDDVYYLPPWETTFSVDCGPQHTTWRFDTLPGGADRYAYLDDFYVVPPTCGDYDCRDYYIDLGFIPDSHFLFPAGGGQHTVHVTVRDYAGNSASQSYTYTVIGPPEGTTIWQDDFEADLGWVVNPDDTDTATSGVWERGDPEATYSNGPKQLGTTVSGVNDLVTGRLAGANANTYDIDGGVTSIRSPEITLPVTDALTLSFRYYLAHGSNSSTADYLRIKVVGSTTATVFEELGAADDDDAAWAIENVSLNAFAGQTVYLLIEAADAGADSLVEAAIDDVIIVAPTNQAPTANPQSVSTAEDTPLGIVLTGSDPDCDPITYSVVSGPSHGALSGTAPNLTYTPAANYYGADGFTFVVSDSLVSSEPATVTIDVTPVNDAPVANPQSVTTVQGRAVAITLTGWDVEGDEITYHVVTQPDHGALGGTAPNLIYMPAPGYTGSDSFAFIVNDGELDSEPAAVSIAINFVTYLPVITQQQEN